MSRYRGITICSYDDFLTTSGLAGILNYELKVKRLTRTDEEYLCVIEYLVDYIVDCKPNIQAGQTIAYHSWILKFEINDGYYEIYELIDVGTDYIEGVDYAIQIVDEQTKECHKYNVNPLFPTFSQNVAISKGLYENIEIQAVRYPSPEHMTGWWLTTDLYDGDINSIIIEPYYTVAFKKPEILKYLAFPFGYRFIISENTFDLWFDNETLDS